MAEINKKIEVKGTINQWQKYLVQDWKNNIKKMRIGRAGALQRSFITSLALKSAGEISKIQFSFLYYGRFIDMGVGKGVKIGDTGTKRKPKKWYSKALAFNTSRLGEILAKKYGEQFAKSIVSNIEIRKT